MPIEVELPDGNIAEFPDGTPPAEIERVLQSRFGAPASQQSQIDRISSASRQLSGGLIEPALSLGSAAIAEPVAGLAGIGSGLFTALQNLGLTEDEKRSAVEAAVNTIGRVRSGITYDPGTAGGQVALQTVMAPSLPHATALHRATEATTELGGQLGGPLGAGILSTVPTVAEIAAGGIVSRTPRGVAAPESSIVRARPEFQGQIANEIRSRDSATATERGRTATEVGGRGKLTEPATDETYAQYTVDAQGRVSPDQIATAAIDQGVNPGMVAAIKESSRKDKIAMLKMLQRSRKGLENQRFAAENRPADVVGKTALDRINFIKNKNKQAGMELDSVASELKGEQIDFSGPYGDFFESLDGVGVKFDADGTPNFVGSDIEGVAAAENVIKRMVGRLSTKKNPDAYDLHRLKRYIDEQVSYGKAGEGLTGRTEGILKGFRSSIDEALDTRFPEYDRVNTQYSDTISALDAFQDAAGRKVNLASPNADKALGTALRKILTNYASRANLIDAASNIDRVVRKYGGTIDEDLYTQVRFAQELDDVFGTAAKGSIRGQVADPIVRALQERQSLRQRAGEKITEAIAGKPSPLKDEAFIAMENLLKRGVQ